jgi:hypothetical protein
MFQIFGEYDKKPEIDPTLITEENQGRSKIPNKKPLELQNIES